MKTIEEIKTTIAKFKPNLNYQFVIYWQLAHEAKVYDVTNQCFLHSELTTGRIQDKYRVTRSSGSGYVTLVTCNVIDDVLEIAQVKCALNRIKEEEDRQISYGNYGVWGFDTYRVYLVKDDPNVYDEFGTIVKKVGDRTINKYIGDMFYKIPEWMIVQENTKAICDWYGATKYGNDDIGTTEIRGYQLSKFLNYRVKEIKNKNSVKSKPKKKSEIEKLLEIPLREYSEEELNNLSGANEKVYIIEDLNDTATCIRDFHRRYYRVMNWEECERTYVTEKLCSTYRIPYYNGKWEKAVFNMDIAYGSKAYPVIGFYETKSKRLKYLQCLLEEDKMNKCLFIAALRYPLIEQGIKSGYPDLCNRLIRDGYIKANCKDLFQEYNTKAKSFLELIGVNKYQAKELNIHFYGERYGRRHINIINFLKQMLGDDYIHADEKSSAEAIQIFSNASSRYYCWNLLRQYRPSNVPEDKLIWFIKRVYRRAGVDGLNQIRDAVNIYSRLPNEVRIDFDWEHFNELLDITRWHDTLVEIDIRRSNEIEAKRLKELEEKRKKVDKERINWEYEDEIAIIRLPKSAYEIKEEGAVLHHCVGSEYYINSHMNGDKTIMFMRDRRRPNEPLCTIEVNNNMIQQIHLKYNAWLGTRPEYIPSVMRWLKKTGFKCSDQILLSTATHYSDPHAKLVKKPIID